MLKKIRGFTLIELLIVVAIIGILAALLIPNVITALAKAKQKATMKEIMTMATAAADYVTDNGVAPESEQGAMGPIFIGRIVPFYTKTASTNDQWNWPYQVYTGSGVAGSTWAGNGVIDVGVDDFMIGSFGRDQQISGFTFDTSVPDAGLFTVRSMLDFASDLVNWNGNWISAPKARTQ